MREEAEAGNAQKLGILSNPDVLRGLAGAARLRRPLEFEILIGVHSRSPTRLTRPLPGFNSK